MAPSREVAAPGSGQVERTFALADGRVAHLRFTSRASGDLAVTRPPGELRPRRAAVVDLPWTWLRQVHGPEVAVVTAAGDRAGDEADAAVTSISGAALAVHTADCAPVALVSPEGVVAVVHAGWRGLVAGVVAAALRQMSALGARTVRAVVGPCIHPECYEFGPDELARAVDALGPDVRARTATDAPALDVPAAVRAALGPASTGPAPRANGARPNVLGIETIEVCTACDPGFFSHRARRDAGRQAVVAWIAEPGPGNGR